MPAYYKRKDLKKVEEELDLMIIETGLNSEKNWEDSLKEHNDINTVALHEEHCNETTEKEERKIKLIQEMMEFLNVTLSMMKTLLIKGKWGRRNLL